MDKRLIQRFESWTREFKDNIKNELIRLDGFDGNNEKKSEFLNYIYEYEKMLITRADFMKRKRVKNAIPKNNRCNACKAGGEQCTRRRKEGSLYCGTHLKGAPHGEVTTEVNETNKKQIEITAQDVNGIIYYLDSFGNIYKMEDVLKEVENPSIIGKYIKLDDDYQIVLN